MAEEIKEVNKAVDTAADEDKGRDNAIIELKLNILAEKLFPDYEKLVIGGRPATEEERESGIAEIAAKLVGEKTDDLDRVKEQLSEWFENEDVSIEALQEGVKLAEKLSNCPKTKTQLGEIYHLGLCEVYGIEAVPYSIPFASGKRAVLSNEIVGFTRENVILPCDPFGIGCSFLVSSVEDRKEVLQRPSLGLIDPTKVSIDISKAKDNFYAAELANLCATVDEVRIGNTTVHAKELFIELEDSREEEGYLISSRNIRIDEDGYIAIEDEYEKGCYKDLTPLTVKNEVDEINKSVELDAKVDATAEADTNETIPDKADNVSKSVSEPEIETKPEAETEPKAEIADKKENKGKSALSSPGRCSETSAQQTSGQANSQTNEQTNKKSNSKSRKV